MVDTICYILKYRGHLRSEIILSIWEEFMTASEASEKLGKNPKYIYLLWKRESNLLLKDSVKLRGNTLLISREGYEHLRALGKKRL